MIEDDSELLKGSRNDEDLIAQYDIKKKLHGKRSEKLKSSDSRKKR